MITKYLSINNYFRFLSRKMYAFNLYLKGLQGKRRFERDYKRIKALYSESLSIENNIRPSYEYYIRNVSEKGHAISIELAIFMTIMCHFLNPKRVLDTGSGFSSFIFRSYKLSASPRPEVYSVDDNEVWLEKTRDYLKNNDLSCENLELWDTFSNQDHDSFDLILHDLNGFPKRIDVLPHIFKLISPGGMIILDDFYVPDYQSQVKAWKDKFGYDIYDISYYTNDFKGRYSALLTNFN